MPRADKSSGKACQACRNAVTLYLPDKLDTRILTMRHLFSAALFTWLFLPLSAQNIPIEFIENPDRPVAIENPATGKTMFFFYPENLSAGEFAREGNPWKACEIDSKTLQVLRSSAGAYLRVARSTDLKFRVICRFAAGDEYFMALENSKKCLVYRFAGRDLSMTVVDSFKAAKGVRILGAVTNRSGAYILCTRKARKEGHQMIVYETGADGRLKEHRFKADPRRNYIIEQVFSNKFKPLAVQEDLEIDPKPASSATKIFAGDRKLRITFDDANVGTVYTSTTAILRVMTLDLENDSMRIKPYYYTDSLVPDALYERRSSYIYDNKLFQFYLNNEQVLLRIRDLESGKPLFTKSLLREDTIGGLASSPILVPGRGVLGQEQEYRSVRKFSRRFSKFDPFIQVRRAGDDYLLCIGGYENVQVLSALSSGGPGFTTAVPGSSWVNTWSASYGLSFDRSFSFYSAVNANTMQRSDAYYEKSLIAAYDDMLEKVKRPRDQALYRIGGKFYLGYYDSRHKEYRLRQIEHY